MRDVVHLEGLLVAVGRALDLTTSKIPVVGVADDAGERWKLAVLDLCICKSVHGREISEIELAD